MLEARTVRIACQNGEGHRLSYVAELVTYAEEQGDNVLLLVTPEVRKRFEWTLFADDIEQKCEVVAVQSEDLVSEALKAGADLVVMPDGDRLLLQVMLQRIRIHRSARPHLRLLLMRLRPQRWTVVGCMVLLAKLCCIIAAPVLLGVEVFYLRSPVARAGVMPSVPDPVSTHCSQADKNWADSLLIPDVDVCFGMFGFLSARKNVELVLRALVASGRPRVGVIVAGTVDDGYRKMLEQSLAEANSSGLRARFVERAMTDGELNAIVAAVDVVIIAQSNEGPSGIAAKAIASGSQVLSAGARSLRNDSARVGARFTWVPLDEKALAKVIAVTEKREKVFSLHGPQDLFTRTLMGDSPLARNRSCKQ